MSLKRKMEEEQGRSAPKLVLPAGMKPPKPDTTVGTDLDWLREVRGAPFNPYQAHCPVCLTHVRMTFCVTNSGVAF